MKFIAKEEPAEALTNSILTNSLLHVPFPVDQYIHVSKVTTSFIISMATTSSNGGFM